MASFVIGDIHGGYRALVQCLQRSGFNYEEDTLIQLGDITDGYDDVFACVEELLKIRHLVAIKGNHDDWFQTFIQTGFHPQLWAQGGEGTLRSYLAAAGKQDLIPDYGHIHPLALIPGDVPATHREFFYRQQLYYIDAHNNCFVHAGFDRQRPFSPQLPHLYFWDRELWLQALSWEATARGKKRPPRFRMTPSFREVFIGHTRTIMWGTDKPMKAANVNNLDTGGGGGGKLTIMEVQSKEYWQSDPVDSLYAISYR